MPDRAVPRAQPVVLVLDDDADTADSIADCLDFRGVRALRVATFADARWQLEHATDVDVVVADYAMPLEDPRDLLGDLRKLERGAPVPVVVVCGPDTFEEIAPATREHHAEIVRKPVGIAELVEAVRLAQTVARRATASAPTLPALAAQPRAHSAVRPRAPARTRRVVEIGSSRRDPRTDPDD